jgi:hypothetical protein
MKSSAPSEALRVDNSGGGERRISDDSIKKVARNAEREIENTEKLLEKIQGKIDAETRERILSEVAVARAFLVEGATFAASGDSSGAFEAYRQSIAVSAKLSVILKAFQKERLRLIPRTPIAPVFSKDEHSDDDGGESRDGRGKDGEEDARVSDG